MSTLPITHVTLYKHGIGYFERQSEFSGQELALTFRVDDMNDILKSLTVIDRGAGQVLGVDYTTPQTQEERLAGNSIRLDDHRSLRDLIVALRGRRVRLLLDQSEALLGMLLGLDELPEEQPLANFPVTILLDESNQVQTVALGRVQGIELLDEQAADDLRFFLQTARGEVAYRQVNVRLTEGQHDLAVSYVAPAPTWRVSYRLVADPQDEMALLMGWGIFDNRLEEDLENVSLALVAGMPISFVYDLYTPFLPQRPEVEEESRVAAAPVDFAGAVMEEAPQMPAPAAPAAARTMAGARPPASARKAVARDAMREAAPVDTSAEALGELFQYRINTPVTVRRGQSAMVPIVSSDLAYRKSLLYNGSKLPAHPVATLRLQNESGLTLERGPITVYEGGEYVGEALLPFTAAGSEFIVAYAVELNVKVQEQAGSSREIHSLHVRGASLIIEEWDIRRRQYRLNNQGAETLTVLIEHPRNANYELFETLEAAEKSDDYWRFAVEVPARGESLLTVSERRLISRRESLQRQSFEQLQRYLRRRLIDRATHDRVLALLRLWEQLADKKQRLEQLDSDREKIYRSQQQIQDNMQALSTTGREGQLRARYVEQLEASEAQLANLSQEEARLKVDIQRLEEEIEQQLKSLEG